MAERKWNFGGFERWVLLKEEEKLEEREDYGFGETGFSLGLIHGWKDGVF